MDEGLLGCIQRHRNGGDIRSLVELVANAEALEILVSVELLVVVVGNRRLELGFVFRAHHRDSVATEVGTGHCQYVGIGFSHYVTNDSTEVITLVGRGMMKLVDADEGAVQLGIVQVTEGVAEGGMGADEDSCLGIQEVHELFAESTFLQSSSAEVVAGAYLPVGKEAVGLKLGILEGTGDGFLRHGDNDLLDALVGQFVEGNEHHGAALTGCRRSLDQQVLAVACFVDDSLHFSHTEGIYIGGCTGAGILYVD